MNDKFLQSLFDLADLISRYSFIERFHFIQETGLSHSQMMSLFYLNRNQDVAINSLATYLDISNPAVSQMVEKLVRSGLVRRISNPHDRRGKLLELTEDGKNLVSQAKIAHHRWIQALAEIIEPEQMPVIEESIRIILEKHASLQSANKQSSLQGEK
jgi:DNA-binding MarR family transcriptional regulator